MTFLKRLRGEAPPPPDLRRRVFEAVLAEGRQHPPERSTDHARLRRALRRLFRR